MTVKINVNDIISFNNDFFAFAHNLARGGSHVEGSLGQRPGGLLSVMGSPQLLMGGGALSIDGSLQQLWRPLDNDGFSSAVTEAS